MVNFQFHFRMKRINCFGKKISAAFVLSAMPHGLSHLAVTHSVKKAFTCSANKVAQRDYVHLRKPGSIHF